MTFTNFSQDLSKIEATTSRNEITKLLADLLQRAAKQDADKVVYLALGRIAPLYQNIQFNLAEKMVIRAVTQAYGMKIAKVQSLFKKSGDLGQVAEQLASLFKGRSLRTQASPLSVNQVFTQLSDIATDSGPGSQERKLTKTAKLLCSLDPLGTRYVVRIILGKLRLGFSDKTVLDALSFMIVGDKSARKELEHAYNVRPDIGWLAKEVKNVPQSRTHGKAGKKLKMKNLTDTKPHLGIPVLPALCQRLPSAEKIVEKMCRPPRPQVGGRAGVAVEPKFDGQRIQAHLGLNPSGKLKVVPTRSRIPLGGKNGKLTNVKLFTRGLEDVTEMFPDLVKALSSPSSFGLRPSSLILDGEVIGINPKSGKVLPFQTMITRKRKYGVQQKLKEVPIRYLVFDILLKEGKSLINEPFSKRRTILEKIFPPRATRQPSTSNSTPRGRQAGSRGEPRAIQLAEQVVTNNPNEIRAFHQQQIKAGLEGIVAKKRDAPYVPGRTGYTWVKLKWEGGAKAGGLLDTMDCVVMGTYVGRGKRSHFGVGAFLVGVVANKSGKFVTISKIGTGLTDKQWQQLQATSYQLQAKKQPKEYDVPKELIPDSWLKPKLVVEIQADNLTRSPLHSAGYALRFPRLLRYRDDKRPEQATTLKETKKLFQMQKKK